MDVNFLDSDDATSRVRDAYADGTYSQLAEIKAHYDPENAFHHNKNIQPHTPTAQEPAAETHAS